MASAKRDIRTLIESLSEDLLLIARDIVEAHVARAVSEWQAKNEKDKKVQLRKSAEDERTRRNQQALERIERVAARRREREAKKAAANALRMEQRALTETAAPARKPRARRGLLADGTEASAKKEPTPPPLFVHKRRRDGEIEQLKRDDAPAPAAAPVAEAAI